jgi:serine/threonine protein kinase
MDWCGGSMLDYCRGILDKSFASLVKSADVMWQITCGLDFLHSHKIDPGNLKSKNVLFWKKNSKSRQVVVKLTEYGYSYHRCEVHYSYRVSLINWIIPQRIYKRIRLLTSLLCSVACSTLLPPKKKPDPMAPLLLTA